MPQTFVKNLALADAPSVQLKRSAKAELPAAGDTFDKPTGYVAGGSLVSFAAGVTGQTQSDVLNSTLLAQLAADKKFDRQSKVMDWYGYYQNVLGQIGWVLQGFDFKTYSMSSASFTADEAILEIVAAALTGQEELVIAAVMDGLKKNAAANDGQLQIFDTKSTKGTQANFQVSACTETNGAVALANLAFTFDTKDNVTNVLFFHFKADSTKLSYAANAQTLNTEVYATVRQTVVDKLGDNAKSFISSLDI